MKKIIILSLCILLLASLFGCRAYVEHETKYRYVVGSWDLDSIYVDTKPIKLDRQIVTFNDDQKSGYYTNIEVVTPQTEDASGNIIPEVVKETKVDFVVSDIESAKFTITTSEGAKTFTFAVDEPAQLLHLYLTDAESGQETHYIYSDTDIE